MRRVQIFVALLCAGLWLLPAPPASAEAAGRRLAGVAAPPFTNAATVAPLPGDLTRSTEVPEDPSAAERWFVRQRAYPRDEIPLGAAQRARRAAAELAQPRFASTASASWSPLGPRPIASEIVPQIFSGKPPFSGRVESIALHPTDEQIAYAAAEEGGVWKTTDGGVDWAPIFDEQPTLAIGSVAVDPNRPRILYVGTGAPGFAASGYYGAGLFKSTDSGDSWTRLGGRLFTDCSMPDVAVEPGKSTVVLAAVKPPSVVGATSCASRAGVYRSSDGGATWTRTLEGFASDLAVDPQSPNTWFAGVVGSGVWKSTNDGATWIRLSGGLPHGSEVGRTYVAVAPSDGSRVYAFSEDFRTGDTLGIFTSRNGGASWRSVDVPSDLCGIGGEGGQCFHATALVVDPMEPSTFYAGGVTLYRFTHAGRAHTRLGYGPPGIHVDFHALTFDAAGRLWIGNDGGVYRTSNAGESFDNLNDTLAITQFYPGVSGSLAGTLLAGTQDNGTLAYKGNPAWSEIQGGDGGYTAQNPSNPDVLYATLPFDKVIVKSTDGGLNWVRADSGIDRGDPASFVFPLVMDPSNSKRLLMGTNRVWETTNGARSWHPISPPFMSTITAIGVTAANPDVVYAGLRDGSVRATTDGGGTWRGIGFGLPNRYVTDIEVSPRRPRDAYVTVSGFGSGHVWHTTDLGLPWSDVSADLPDAPVNALAVDWKASPSAAYVASDFGVFSSVNGGRSWDRLGRALPNTIVTDVRLDPAVGRLIAATYGRGMFSIAVDAEPRADLAVEQSATPGSVTTGERVTYSITVRNDGPEGAAGVTVADDLSRLTTFDSAASQQGRCRGSRTVVCSVGRIAAGSSVGITIVARASAGGTAENEARVTGRVDDPVPSNNDARVGTLSRLGAECTIVGTDRGEFLLGTPGDDRMCARGGQDFVAGLGGDDVLDGGDGFDWVDYKYAFHGVNADLAAGSAVGDGSDTFQSFDAIFGSFADDHLSGNSGGNTFEGFPGRDVVEGGGGFDRVTYANASGPERVDLAAGRATGNEDTDVLSGIAGVFGSDYNDTLAGDALQNDLSGFGGNDRISGGGCTNCRDFAKYEEVSGPTGVRVNLATGRVSGSAGHDRLSEIDAVFASNASDTLIGNAHENSFYGLKGNDLIKGRAGEDIVYYSEAGPPGVLADLSTGDVSGSEGTDKLVGIEDIFGSFFSDRIVGSATPNALLGDFGADVIDARDGIGGNDYINGGPDTDDCHADPGDTIQGCP